MGSLAFHFLDASRLLSLATYTPTSTRVLVPVCCPFGFAAMRLLSGLSRSLSRARSVLLCSFLSLARRPSVRRPPHAVWVTWALALATVHHWPLATGHISDNISRITRARTRTQYIGKNEDM